MTAKKRTTGKGPGSERLTPSNSARSPRSRKPRAPRFMRQRRFPKAVLEALASAKMVGIRSGRRHRFTGVWIVVVRGRVFIRSWNDKANGWHRSFGADPLGAVRWGSRSIFVRAKTVRGAALLDAIDRAYKAKYDTRASQKWVRGFRLAWRRATTTELVPR